ncbi:prepilin-type N-terminal cleavage/methylation domain-containing protein [Pseudoalteromonas sp. APAL1]|uniref:type IV pilus modification PilV family protein n=1 Tax=Pseudoalteromonas TaxID=53246 RepID=UPI000ED8BF22|nr:MULTISPECIES: prepilin-type N-terminal cleavage/methylation domain-containing protein [unclassified Pseudoalteromonas]MCF2920312.1 prepilin-type N-terminal cleavage/methylation domain-containing protein [Pseudoalteromonas sp. APAL1]HCV01388.1 prepilin-type cleavage/methylation domain-containing protein [Pseudoalteromonas sp.]|tara:strand:+ start:2012 stop:2410 length:399 start_codon:yes stop_codon:yes gene_type:complete
MKKQAGFSLLEVMISVVIAGIALLGLAAAQLKSLQYATNSFHYTVSLIQGQNTIERLWPHVCEIQKTDPALFQNATFRESLKPQVNDYQLTIPASYSNDMQINVGWVDKRMTDNAENQISLNASFPDLSAAC